MISWLDERVNGSRRFLEMLAALIVFWGIYSGGEWFYYKIIRPSSIEIHEIKQVSDAYPGGNLLIKIYRTKNEDCPSDWDSWLIAENGLQYLLSSKTSGSAVGIGTDSITISHKIPENIPPGKYRYRAVGIYKGSCNLEVIRQALDEIIVKEKKS